MAFNKLKATIEKNIIGNNMSTLNGILLSEAIKEMEEAIYKSDLSDNYLNNYCEESCDREKVFAKECEYGITMVPCSFAIQLAKKVLEHEGDQVISYE